MGQTMTMNRLSKKEEKEALFEKEKNQIHSDRMDNGKWLSIAENNERVMMLANKLKIRL